MNPIFQQIIIDAVKRHSKKDKRQGKDFENEIAEFIITLKNFFSDLFFIILGVISASFGLKGFLLPNSFIDGGVLQGFLLL